MLDLIPDVFSSTKVVYQGGLHVVGYVRRSCSEIPFKGAKVEAVIGFSRKADSKPSDQAECGTAEARDRTASIHTTIPESSAL